MIALDTQVDPELHLSANGRYVAVKTLLADGTPAIAAWDIQTVRRLRRPIAAEAANVVAVDSRGESLAIGGRDPWVRVWSLATDDPQKT